MRIFGITQGSNLKVFLQLTELLREVREVDAVGALVADSMAFRKLEHQETLLADRDVALLKEWELVSAGRCRQPDWERIANYERELGDPVLWNALMADRRIFFGRRCKQRQDYRPRFSHDEMGGILLAALEGFDHFLREFRPDLVLGFGTSTIGDYLGFRFAKARGIAYLQLKATKIGNRVALNDDAIELSSHIGEFTEGRRPIPEQALVEARDYIASVNRRGVVYEGAIQRRRRFPLTQSLTLLARGAAVDMRRRLDPVTRDDNHPEAMLPTYLYERFLNPAKAAVLGWRLGRHLVRAEDLQNRRPFAFFPLHFEPEVSLQVFGRPFQNQIELIRLLAANLPAGMEVLVKEHPRAQGFRPWSYYRKLLEIPNVRLVEPALPTHVVSAHATLVAVISGSTGLEAAICGKPVITFGIPVYNLLHGSMLRHITDLHRLGEQIRDLLDNYRLDENALERFVAATVAGSVPVDLYTALLGKPGRVREGRDGMSDDQRRHEDYRKLAEYCDSRIRDCTGA